MCVSLCSPSCSVFYISVPHSIIKPSSEEFKLLCWLPFYSWVSSQPYEESHFFKKSWRTEAEVAGSPPLTELKIERPWPETCPLNPSDADLCYWKRVKWIWPQSLSWIQIGTSLLFPSWFNWVRFETETSVCYPFNSCASLVQNYVRSLSFPFLAEAKKWNPLKQPWLKVWGMR